MNYQQLVSVCSHTGVVILLVASHPTHTNFMSGYLPETKVIVVEQPSQASEKA
jgi:hypothetical protein